MICFLLGKVNVKVSWWSSGYDTCPVSERPGFDLPFRHSRFNPLWQFYWVSLNVFTEFSDKNTCHYSKRARTCHQATSCVRDPDASTAPARHMWGSSIWAQFMLQWFIRFPEFSEFLFHLGKPPVQFYHFVLTSTPLYSVSASVMDWPSGPVLHWSAPSVQQYLLR